MASTSPFYVYVVINPYDETRGVIMKVTACAMILHSCREAYVSSLLLSVAAGWSQ